MKTICQIYSEAQKLQEKGVKVISTDEKTGIQSRLDQRAAVREAGRACTHPEKNGTAGSRWKRMTSGIRR